MNVRYALLILLFIAPLHAGSFLDKTAAMHSEAREYQHPNLTQDSHPVLYGMIKNLTEKANIPMPRYISAHEAEYSVVSDSGVIYKTAAGTIGCWANLLGDLHICREILVDLTYEEVEGIIAVALAEKVTSKSAKVALIGVSSFAATIATLYVLNKQYNLDLSTFIFGDQRNYRSSLRDRQGSFEGFVHLTLLPALLTTKIAANNLQKQVDLQAACLTNPRQVIQGIQALIKLEDKYIKEDFLSRVAVALKLKAIFNVLFYPIRAFTPEERVQYLEVLAAE
ncbi:MAG: hypothetical protein ACHQVS_02900 [Candidatus Babeliales bacterium]